MSNNFFLRYIVGVPIVIGVVIYLVALWIGIKLADKGGLMLCRMLPPETAHNVSIWGLKYVLGPLLEARETFVDFLLKQQEEVDALQPESKLETTQGDSK